MFDGKRSVKVSMANPHNVKDEIVFEKLPRDCRRRIEVLVVVNSKSVQNNFRNRIHSLIHQVSTKQSQQSECNMDCSLCCEPFSEEGRRVPRNLDCGHTFCTECIQELDRHASLRQGPRCPDCRALIKTSRRSISNLPKNYKLLELIRERSIATTTIKPGADTSETYYENTVANDSAPASRSQQQQQPCAHGGRSRQVEEDGEDVPLGTPAEIVFGLNYSSPSGRIVPYPSPFGEFLSAPLISFHRSGLESSRTARRIGEEGTTTGTVGGVHFRLPPPPPPPPPSAPHEDQISRTLISSPLFSSQTSVILPTPSTPLVFPSPLPETNVPVPSAVETGRAVNGPNGTLVCKFFQEGTCRYGPYCWFSHPVLNENKAICRHWKKGQCRMGLSCNYRHGSQFPIQQSRRTRLPSQSQEQNQTNSAREAEERDPAAAGPSEEGTSRRRNSRPSVVVFVSNWGNSIHRPSENEDNSRPSPQQAQQRRHIVLSAATTRTAISESSESETFFDVFGNSNP